MQMILDTDLQKHFIIMNKFKSALALSDINMGEESNRLLCLSAALKCAGTISPSSKIKKNEISDMGLRDWSCIRNGAEESLKSSSSKGTWNREAGSLLLLCVIDRATFQRFFYI